MSIYSEIDRLELAKENLKLKLESKGVTVPEDARISDYPALINLLPIIKESEFTNRIVDDGNSGTGKAKIYNIKGKSLVWNQIASGVLSSNIGQEFNGIITTYNSTTNTFHIQGTASGNFDRSITYQNSVVSGHKYLILFTDMPTGVNGDVRAYFYATGFTCYNGNIETSSISGNVTSYIFVKNGITINKDFKINFIDLTLLYGAEIDGLTDDEILAKYEAEFGTGYHEYNAGTLINNDAEAIESIGFNQWDEEWENGYYTGTEGETLAKAANSNFIRCTNLIKVMPSTDYNFHFGNIGSGWMVKEIDENGIVVKSTTSALFNLILTTDSRTRYVVWFISQLATYNNNICINLSNPAKNGTYEPYKKFTLPLSLNSFNVKDSEDNIITVNGLNSSRSVYDEISGKYIKRFYKIVFTGNETYWRYDANTFKTTGVIFNMYPMPNFNAEYDRGNGLSGHFGLNTPSIGVPGNGTWDITDSNMWGISFSSSLVPSLASSTNVDDWKVWLAAQYAAGTPLTIIYEIATPIEYELVDEIDTIYDVDKNGVERIVSPAHADGSPSAPFRASIGYPVDQEQ